ncbi:hypothetical protein SAMN04487786_0194 [Paenisporosarcina quisquiliarum]|nr:hypothetical protein SAMN04487786_0194 [Paenisporosarcina quisquiliarum]
MACSCPLFSSAESSRETTSCATFGCGGDSGRQKKITKTITFCKVWLQDVTKLVQCNETQIGCCG